MRVTLAARVTEPRVIVSGRQDVEHGQATRHQEMRNLNRSTSHLLPLGWDAGPDFSYEGEGAVNTDYAYGEHASASAAMSDGVRKEETASYMGEGGTVATRVDWDATVELVTYDRHGNEQVVKTFTRTATGSADLSMSQRHLSEMLARPDDPAPPTSPERPKGWPRRVALPDLLAAAQRDPAFDPADPYPAMASVLRGGTSGDRRQPVLLTSAATATSPVSALTDARLLARQLGSDVHLYLRDGGTTHHYQAAPDGALHSTDDSDFASAFASLPTRLLPLVEGLQVDLREVFRGMPRGADFAEAVRERLVALGGQVTDPAAPWPTSQDIGTHGQPPAVGTTYQGGGGATGLGGSPATGQGGGGATGLGGAGGP